MISPCKHSISTRVNDMNDLNEQNLHEGRGLSIILFSLSFSKHARSARDDVISTDKIDILFKMYVLVHKSITLLHVLRVVLLT